MSVALHKSWSQKFYLPNYLPPEINLLHII